MISAVSEYNMLENLRLRADFVFTLSVAGVTILDDDDSVVIDSLCWINLILGY